MAEQDIYAYLESRIENLERELASLAGQVVGLQRAVKAILVAAHVFDDTTKKKEDESRERR